MSNALGTTSWLSSIGLISKQMKRGICSNNDNSMDTPFPTLSAEEFDAMVNNQAQAEAAPMLASGAHEAQASAAHSASGLPANLLQALAWSLELSPQVMTNLISRALQSMDRKLVSLAGTEQAQLLEAAAVAMEEQRMPWARQYTALLRVAMAYPAPAKMAAILPKVDLRICAAEAAQLEAMVQEPFEAPASLRGSKRRNPLGPQAYVQALLELIARSEAPQLQRQIWADHLLAALSSQLAWVYLQLQAVLRDPLSREASALAAADGFAAYAAVAYGLAQAEANAAADEDDAGAGMNTQTQQLAEQARRTVLRLRQHLGLPAQDEAPENALAQALDGNPMDALLRDLDVAEQLMAHIRERGLPMPSLDDDADAVQTDAATLSAEASSPAPLGSVSEEQITSLIKSYQNTTSPSLQRVPVPLREALVDLQPMLFALAQQEPHLLTDDTHPAQQFLILITQRSLRYSSEMAEGFAAFMGSIDKLLEAISAMRSPSSRGFEQACNSLRLSWQRQDDAVAQEQQRKALEQEQMQAAKQLAGRLGFELVGRRDAGDAPPMIKQFLMGPWAQVLARAQLFPQQSGDVQRYTQVIAGLLWSVSLRRAAPRKGEHAALVSQLMPQLKVGLQSINMPDVQADPLLADIKKLQEAVQASVVAADADTSVSDAAPLLAA